MRTKLIIAATLSLVLSAGAFAQNESNFKFYGFIRNYAHVDTKESLAGTVDLFNYVPKPTAANYEGNVMSYHMTAITSRVGVDVSGYEFNGMKVGAKMEADFYNGPSGVTGTAVLRLRQAYMTLGWDNGFSVKAGQGVHPMAADMPDVISLNTGAPFGPFSRTPYVQIDQKLSDGWSISAAGIWQMQYPSCGPNGASADYIKNSGIPELYFAVNRTSGNALFRLGVNMLSLKPYVGGKRENEFSAYFYGQYKEGLFSAKLKTTVAQDGSQMNLNGGYAVTAASASFNSRDWEFTPTRNSSTWLSLSYGSAWQAVLFAGYVKNFGTAKEILGGDFLYFSKNSYKQMRQMYRLSPTIIRNMGKVALALECEITGVEYGSRLNTSNGLYEVTGVNDGWLTNTRLQLMLKYTF
ncbi:MAG: hypothetical protein IKI70_07485 [Bacteroidales bacterium]|nr:hypothetical protein [Bacteroidales bacterium]